MKSLKKIISIGVCFIICISLSISVNASDGREGDYMEGGLDSEVAEGYEFLSPQARGTLMSGGYSNIVQLGSGVIGASGNTSSSRVCDIVTLNLNVERLLGDNWVTYTNRLTTLKNTAKVDYYVQLVVPKGYYYRVSCSHFASKSGATESITTHSPSLFIN